MEIRSEEIIGGAKKFIGAFLGLAKIELDESLSLAGKKTLWYGISTLVAVLAVAWLSVALYQWEAAYFPPIVSALSMCVLFAVIAVAGFGLTSRLRVEISTESQTALKRLSDGSFLERLTPESLDAETEKRDGAQKEAFIDQIHAAQESIIESSKELKDEAVKAINPMVIAQNLVMDHPKAFLYGGLAVGCLWGLSNNVKSAKKKAPKHKGVHASA